MKKWSSLALAACMTLSLAACAGIFGRDPQPAHGTGKA